MSGQLEGSTSPHTQINGEEKNSDTPATDSSHIGGPKKKRRLDRRSRHWFLTWNNWIANDIKILQRLGATMYAFQEETGASGTPHIQGVFSFNQPKRWSTLDKATKHKAIWDPARNVAACRNYCTKKATRSGKQWVLGYTFGKRKVKDPLEGKALYNWQRKVIQSVQGIPHDRHIYWYWSTKGGIGKSALCKHLVMADDAIYVGGKFSDAFYAIKSCVDKGKDPHIVIFDIPRAQGDKCSYVAIEEIKNGLIFNAKYESGMCVFNIPHIILMANCPPNYDKLSMDRWVVTDLDLEEDLKHL